ncbi:MAG TPA: sigma-70 family RNA polymerase sigma factor [Streptosporangiaceae bacterium]
MTDLIQRRSDDDEEVPGGVLLAAAAGGNEVAWATLVARYDRLLWTIARMHDLDAESAADVCQTTWLRLVERVDRLRDPDRVGAWLATTARHESRRTLRKMMREKARNGAAALNRASDIAPAPGADDAVWHAVAAMPERCNRLLRLLFLTPQPRYSEIAAALDMPIGSIGPTRSRCLRRLRTMLESDGEGRDIA